mmetsp:Transcript_72928/g.84606  ORF Transcript_72928/g.84606 Transcript_72928/m.84606 type:complete len:650 (+) Transcript_72928:43-1992(+)
MSSSKKQKQQQKSQMKPNKANHKSALPDDNDIIDDDRFKVIHNDPRFSKLSKKKLKLKIDSRFKPMMTDARFGVASAVDKYGRKLVAPKRNKELEEFYDVEDDEDEIPIEDDDDEDLEIPMDSDDDDENGVQLDGEEEEEEPAAKKKGKNKNNKAQKRGQKKNNQPRKPSFYDKEGNFKWNEVSSSEDEQDLNKKLEHADESDEYDEDALRELDEDEGQFKWSSEEEDNIPKTEPTKRLALVNYDWMNINAPSIMLTLSSFVPKNGFIKKVSVHPSLFGLERMKQEQIAGPNAIWKTNQKVAEDEKEIQQRLEKSIIEAKDEWIVHENKEGDIDAEKLRQYEKDRLRYYFAIIECDSVATADKIYEECNKYEFEKTAIKIDLRFVPTTEKITTEATEVCTEIPSKGKVSNFLNRAIQHTNVKLTWEEPDYKKFEVFYKDLKEEDYDKVDIDEYLGELSESDEENDRFEEEEQPKSKKKNGVDLLSGAKTEGSWKDAFDKGKRRQKRDEELIITFNPGFSTKGNSILEKEDRNPDRKKQYNPKFDRNTRGKAKDVENDKDFFVEDPARLEAAAEDEKYKKSKKYKDELELMIDEKPKNAKEFKVSFDDKRFQGLFEDSRYGVDPTSKYYTKENTEKVLKEQIVRRKIVKK